MDGLYARAGTVVVLGLVDVADRFGTGAGGLHPRTVPYHQRDARTSQARDAGDGQIHDYVQKPRDRLLRKEQASQLGNDLRDLAPVARLAHVLGSASKSRRRQIVMAAPIDASFAEGEKRRQSRARGDGL